MPHPIKRFLVRTLRGYKTPLTIKRAHRQNDFIKARGLLTQLMPYLKDAPFLENVKAARAQGYKFFMAYDRAGNLVGCVGYWIYVLLGYGRTLYVTHLVVDENKRGQGIGRRLMQFLDTRAAAEKCNWVQLYSNHTRDRTHKFYDSLGFARVGIEFEKRVPLPLREGQGRG